MKKNIEEFFSTNIIYRLQVSFLKNNKIDIEDKQYMYYVGISKEKVRENGFRIPAVQSRLKRKVLSNVRAVILNNKETTIPTKYSNDMIIMEASIVQYPLRLDIKNYKFIFDFDEDMNASFRLKENLCPLYNIIPDGYTDAYYNDSTEGYYYTRRKKEFEKITEETYYMPQNEINNKKEDNEMNIMKGMNFEFGPVGDEIKLAVNGIAFRNDKGNYVSYNIDTNTITDVSDFCFDMKGMLYAIPVAINNIKKNDIIAHKGRYVVAIEDFNAEKGNCIEVINPIGQVKTTILPTQNIFGFNFITKVVNFAEGMFTTSPNPENPFGNIMPMIMMSSFMSDDKDNNSNDFIKIMFMSQMIQNGNIFQNTDSSNPFENIMPFMMMKSIIGDN